MGPLPLPWPLVVPLALAAGTAGHIAVVRAGLALAGVDQKGDVRLVDCRVVDCRVVEPLLPHLPLPQLLQQLPLLVLLVLMVLRECWLAPLVAASGIWETGWVCGC